MEESRLAVEMGRAELGDARRSRRLSHWVAKLEAQPSLSLPRALTGAELEAAYRWLSNEAVTAEAILQPHVDATVMRAEAIDTVLAVHDSTVLTLGGTSQRKGLAPTRGRHSAQGFLAHVTLALTPGEARRPLGTLGRSTRVRPERKAAGTGQACESAQGWDPVERAEREVAQAGKLLHVMDREADDDALMARMQQAGYRFVMRLAHHRRIKATQGPSQKRLDGVTDITCQLEREVTLSSRKAPKQPKAKRIHPARLRRATKLCVGAMPVTLQRPQPQSGQRRRHAALVLPETLTLQLVRVWEADPPDPDTAVQWLLLTNEPVSSPEALAAVVDTYRSRGAIEDCFKALKTGCADEQRQLEGFHALRNGLALFMPIAYQLLLLRSQARVPDDRPAETVLHPLQLRVLKRFARTKLPPNPTAQQAYRAIAALGGYLPHNRDPGWLTLLRGYAELTR